MPITVNLNGLRIGDLELLDKAESGELSTSELIDFLDRTVEGNIRELPLPALRDILLGLRTGIDELANPEVGGKN